jgi:outer membrane protein assembly factor BamB
MGRRALLAGTGMLLASIAGCSTGTAGQAGGTRPPAKSGPGSLAWQVAVTGTPTETAPLAADGVLYWGIGDDLAAFSTATGRALWRAPLGDTIMCQPMVTAGIVYVAVNPADLFAISAATGSVLWKYGADLGSSTSGLYPLWAVADGRLYYADSTGELQVADARTGSLANRHFAQQAGTGYFPGMTVADGTLYAVEDPAGYLAEINASTGAIQRRIRFQVPGAIGSPSTGMTISGGSLYVALNRSNDPDGARTAYVVYSVGLPTGQTRWSFALAAEMDVDLAVSANRIFAVAGLKDGTDTLYALDRATGAVAWKHPAPSGTGIPSVAGDSVYLVTDDGQLVALRASDGSVTWAYGGEADNVLVAQGAATTDSLVFAFTQTAQDGGNIIALRA